jgi:hypothetical protein
MAGGVGEEMLLYHDGRAFSRVKKRLEAVEPLVDTAEE